MKEKITNKRLLEFYYIGYEIASDDLEFPKWFETVEEKKAILLGYNDFETGVKKEEEDIIQELRAILK